MPRAAPPRTMSGGSGNCPGLRGRDAVAVQHLEGQLYLARHLGGEHEGVRVAAPAELLHARAERHEAPGAELSGGGLQGVRGDDEFVHVLDARRDLQPCQELPGRRLVLVERHVEERTAIRIGYRLQRLHVDALFEAQLEERIRIEACRRGQGCQARTGQRRASAPADRSEHSGPMQCVNIRQERCRPGIGFFTSEHRDQSVPRGGEPGRRGAGSADAPNSFLGARCRALYRSRCQSATGVIAVEVICRIPARNTERGRVLVGPAGLEPAT